HRYNRINSESGLTFVNWHFRLRVKHSISFLLFSAFVTTAVAQWKMSPGFTTPAGQPIVQVNDMSVKNNFIYVATEVAFILTSADQGQSWLGQIGRASC